MANATIYEKIEQKGIADAQKILKAGETKARQILDAAIQEAHEKNALLLAKTTEKNANWTKTKTTEFEQAQRQNILSLKKSLIDGVQSETIRLLETISDAQWKAFVLATLKADDLRGNERIVASPLDQSRFQRLFSTTSTPQEHLVLDVLNRELNDPKFALTLAPQTAPIRGGFLVEGDEFDVDHSFVALVSSLKERHESELAAILFEERG